MDANKIIRATDAYAALTEKEIGAGKGREVELTKQLGDKESELAKTHKETAESLAARDKKIADLDKDVKDVKGKHEAYVAKINSKLSEEEEKMNKPDAAPFVPTHTRVFVENMKDTSKGVF
jgi:predicted  nucleic acid-binding Zn-ribbon protein